MLLLHSLQPGSFRRHCARNVFALVALSFMFAALLFTGCKQEPADETLVSLDGTWVSEWGENFIIDFADMSYNSPAVSDYGDFSVQGNIRGIVYFISDRSAGIIFIKITQKGDDFGTDGNGNYTGVYFEYLDYKTVGFSMAADASTYKTPMYNNLASAKAALNVNSLGDYFAMGSACTKK